MPRWEPDALGRLTSAALELYEERGFDDTTVADIAERAGLSKRTYFHYFADKREVLFAGSDRYVETIVNGIAAQPASLTPLDAMAAAMQGVADTFFADRHEHP